METKILFAAAIFFGGWLWFYLFVRQFRRKTLHHNIHDGLRSHFSNPAFCHHTLLSKVSDHLIFCRCAALYDHASGQAVTGEQGNV